jgi:twitching motility protein PilT
MDTALEELLGGAFADGASDVFLAEGEAPRIRRGGSVLEADLPAVSRDALASLWIACNADPERSLDADSSLVVAGVGRLRVNAYRTLGRLAAVLRPIKAEIPGFAELGLPGDLLSSWMMKPSGLVLVTGPTGSGKSTTLAACLQWLNENMARHVVTIEDPIEYLFTSRHCWFSQREVGHDSATFANALRAALRQSPDVILIGEIRDWETAEIALRAAETGHLVLASLHSSGVAESIERLIRLFHGPQAAASRALLADQLIGVLSQMLLPAPDGSLYLATEYCQNEAATRRWIAEEKITDLKDHLQREESPVCRSFLAHLVEAANEGRLLTGIARSACPRPQDFDRAMRGIS